LTLLTNWKIAVAGDRKQVDKVFDKLEFHP
jgi:hypothetical protein